MVLWVGYPLYQLFRLFKFFHLISDSGKFFGDILQIAHSFKKFVVVKELLLIGIDTTDKILVMLPAS